ncbi:MAG: efflux RND transporter periplasmic adaptor subunit [Gammaproteobacteria bacterium]|nr:efflux RND transporter periplasmic adaptor subunit [Gammaproteobacteria bacterium]MCF6364512.1 efflux RND transporter periplasmic adaptor subunit [Gammaproteobacteria bacterium]
MLNTLTLNRKKSAAILLLILVAMVLFFAIQRVQQRLQPIPLLASAPLAVEALTLAPGPFSIHVDYVGSVMAGRVVQIPAQVGARVMAVEHREGDRVEQGDLLIRLDDRELANEIQRLRANEQRLRSDFDYWERQNRRNITLRQQKVIAENQLDESRRMVDSLRASIHENAEALANAEIRLGYTRIHAPFAGRIARLMTEVGDLAVPLSKPLLELVSLQAMKALVSVPQVDIGRLSSGLVVNLEIPAANLHLARRIEKIYPLLDPVTRNATFEVCLNCAPEALPASLYPGMALEATVVLAQYDEALSIPHHALLWRGDEQGVFLFEDGVARWRPLQSGAVEGGRVLIRSGLKAGDRLIVTPDFRLQDGLAVAVPALSEVSP